MAHRPNPTPDSVSTGSTSNSSPKNISSKPGSSSASSSRVERRKANTLAARRYRHNRLDKVAGLESALKATQLERDAPKVQVAKLQGEIQVLKDLVRGKVKRASMLAWSAYLFISLLQYVGNSNSYSDDVG